MLAANIGSPCVLGEKRAASGCCTRNRIMQRWSAASLLRVPTCLRPLSVGQSGNEPVSSPMSMAADFISM